MWHAESHTGSVPPSGAGGSHCSVGSTTPFPHVAGGTLRIIVMLSACVAWLTVAVAQPYAMMAPLLDVAVAANTSGALDSVILSDPQNFALEPAGQPPSAAEATFVVALVTPDACPVVASHETPLDSA